MKLLKYLMLLEFTIVYVLQNINDACEDTGIGYINNKLTKLLKLHKLMSDYKNES